MPTQIWEGVHAPRPGELGAHPHRARPGFQVDLFGGERPLPVVTRDAAQHRADHPAAVSMHDAGGRPGSIGEVAVAPLGKCDQTRVTSSAPFAVSAYRWRVRDPGSR